MSKRSLTPQEKKELSYARDGRNTVAESRGSAHKRISVRRAKAHRAFRRAEAKALREVAEPDADVFVPRIGRKSFKKWPDAPLGEYVAARLESRETGEMNAGDKRSPILEAARRRTRVRPVAFMGGFYRGQNRAAARARAAEAEGDVALDGD
ncbi:MAG TPA: hypothetical protein VEQ60_20130 [Longimicrobium sp.]|nr:hypothetical protein [Longimicrobium sp.]